MKIKALLGLIISLFFSPFLQGENDANYDRTTNF